MPEQRLSKDKLPDVMRPTHLASYLGHDLKRIYRLLNASDIPGTRKLGGFWYIDRDAFLEWWESA